MERKAGIRLSSALKARVKIVTFIPKKTTGEVGQGYTSSSFRKNYVAVLFCRPFEGRRALG